MRCKAGPACNNPCHYPVTFPLVVRGRSPGSKDLVPRLPESMIQWPAETLALSYRCGGSTGMLIDVSDLFPCFTLGSRLRPSGTADKWFISRLTADEPGDFT